MKLCSIINCYLPFITKKIGMLKIRKLKFSRGPDWAPPIPKIVSGGWAWKKQFQIRIQHKYTDLDTDQGMVNQCCRSGPIFTGSRFYVNFKQAEYLCNFLKQFKHPVTLKIKGNKIILPKLYFWQYYITRKIDLEPTVVCLWTKDPQNYCK